MMKLIVGTLAIAALLSGCANQNIQGAQDTSLSAASVTNRSAPPPAKTSPPVTQNNKKKRLAAQTRSRQKTRNRLVIVKRKSAAAPKQKQNSKAPVALNKPKANCKARLPKLPADADQRSAIIGVQCFFIGRGEYLTTTGQVKQL